MSTVTEIIQEICSGSEARSDELLPLVYQELRQLAHDRIKHEKAGQTLQATALVHEAYLRLLGTDASNSPEWNGRGHFFGAASEAMRRILVENARRKSSKRRGGGLQRVELNSIELGVHKSDRLLELNDAIDVLAVKSKENASLVKLILFAGLSVEDASSAIGISTASGYRKWNYSRAFLRAELES